MSQVPPTSIYLPTERRPWAAVIVLGQGSVRATRQISSKLFCHMLHKLAEIHADYAVTGSWGVITGGEWNAKVRSYNGLCHYCQQKIPFRQREVDHMVPVSRGGRNVIDNVVPVCRACNRAKGTRTPEEFLAGRHAKGSDWGRDAQD